MIRKHLALFSLIGHQKNFIFCMVQNIFDNMMQIKATIDQMASMTTDIVQNRLDPQELTQMIITAIQQEETAEGKAIQALLEELKQVDLTQLNEIDSIKDAIRKNQSILDFLMEAAEGDLEVSTFWEQEG